MKISKFHIASIFTVLLLLYFIAGAILGRYSWWLPAIIGILYLMLLVAGSIFIRFNFYHHSKNSLPHTTDSSSPEIALTFDDGPAIYTSDILDILKKEDVTATFFLIGKHIEGNESVIKRMQDEGHTIGNHSYNHGFNFDWQSSASMQREIELTNNTILKITGKHTILFRPPYGVTNPNLSKAIHKSNMKSIGWSLRSLDTVAKSPEQLLNRICSSVKNGDIILLHDSCAITAAILPELIRKLKSRGYRFTGAGM